VSVRPAGLAVACATVALAFVPTAGAHQGAPMWSIPRVMSELDGDKVVIRHWSARVRADTTLCSGEGRSGRWRGMRHWRHFTCTWTVFDRKGLVDRDVTFRVHTLRTGRCLITDARFGAA
jgi:hypothetical protein